MLEMLQLSSNVFSLMDIGDVISFYVQIDCVSVCFCVVFIFYYFYVYFVYDFILNKKITVPQALIKCPRVSSLTQTRNALCQQTLHPNSCEKRSLKNEPGNGSEHNYCTETP